MLLQVQKLDNICPFISRYSYYQYIYFFYFSSWQISHLYHYVPKAQQKLFVYSNIFKPISVMRDFFQYIRWICLNVRQKWRYVALQFRPDLYGVKTIIGGEYYDNQTILVSPNQNFVPGRGISLRVSINRSYTFTNGL